MNFWKPSRGIGYGLAALLFLSACGYHLAGTQNTLPPHLKTVAIPVFKNISTEPEIHRDLTNVIRESFITDGRLKVVDPSKADLVMRGILNYYNLRAVSFKHQRCGFGILC